MRILVTGIGGPAGRNVSQLLWEAGHAVIGTDMRAVDLAELSEFHQSPPANAPDYVAWLRAIAQHVDYIIPTVQDELPTLAAAHPHIGCPLLIGQRQPVEIAHDKLLTARALTNAGVAVPCFALPSALNGADATPIGWPRVAKPRQGRGGRNVTVYDTPGAFADTPPLDDSYIVQTFMPGTEYSVNLFRDDQPQATAQCTVTVLEKLALREGRTGNAEGVIVVDAPDVAALGVAAAAAIGLTGPIDMDIRRRLDGVPTVLEINARFGANIGHAPQVFAAAMRKINSIEADPRRHVSKERHYV